MVGIAFGINTSKVKVYSCLVISQNKQPLAISWPYVKIMTWGFQFSYFSNVDENKAKIKGQSHDLHFDLCVLCYYKGYCCMKFTIFGMKFAIFDDI
ncbi:hypothetical protein KUTeg_013014 [Tegillarca granosa]|uniref:Uncharacterized protein n=1 Tax=Tegillarca granosa TaxID=220873 RepID=A0ABQ9EWK8_TEGGR|nr:hypothetical protein KUTeg_013014 [Tegillarca granosa]